MHNVPHVSSIYPNLPNLQAYLNSYIPAGGNLARFMRHMPNNKPYDHTYGLASVVSDPSGDGLVVKSASMPHAVGISSMYPPMYDSPLPFTITTGYLKSGDWLRNERSARVISSLMAATFMLHTGGFLLQMLEDAGICDETSDELVLLRVVSSLLLGQHVICEQHSDINVLTSYGWASNVMAGRFIHVSLTLLADHMATLPAETMLEMKADKATSNTSLALRRAVELFLGSSNYHATHSISLTDYIASCKALGYRKENAWPGIRERLAAWIGGRDITGPALTAVTGLDLDEPTLKLLAGLRADPEAIFPLEEGALIRIQLDRLLAYIDKQEDEQLVDLKSDMDATPEPHAPEGETL